MPGGGFRLQMNEVSKMSDGICKTVDCRFKKSFIDTRFDIAVKSVSGWGDAFGLQKKPQQFFNYTSRKYHSRLGKTCLCQCISLLNVTKYDRSFKGIRYESYFFPKLSFSNIIVQLRTILQHTWAEIEHDIQYKSSAAIPRDIRRRFMALAGLLEIADREFQAIQDADRDLNQRAERSIEAGQLDAVEITPIALKSYLDRRLGSDGRMSDFSYDWYVRLLLRLGFTSLAQIDQCISPYDNDRLSRLASGTRQGQLSRFEFMLLAGLGDKFLERHLYSQERWFVDSITGRLERFRKGAIPIGTYDPQAQPMTPAVVPSKEGNLNSS